MDTFDFVIIGAGPAGEAAAFKARERGATVAIVDREWFGGSCPFIGCLPSKALLYAAARHAANGPAFPWPKASAHRDFMINREPGAPQPDDSSHKTALEKAGAVAYRGTARIVGRGHVEVRHDDAVHVLEARNVVVAVGSVTKVPELPGLDKIKPWTNREATLATELPKSLVVLGGGPTGCEMAQVYARFGVPTRIVQSGDRLMPTDHPRNAEAVSDGLRASGVEIRLGVRAVAVRPSAGTRRCPRHRPRRRLNCRGSRNPARGRPVVSARRPRARALRHRHERAHGDSPGRPAADRRGPVGDR